MADTTTQYLNPANKNQAVCLRQESRAALRIWLNRYQTRLAAAGRNIGAPTRLDTTAFAAHSPTCAALVTFVEDDAANTALPTYGINRLGEIEFAAAQRIHAEHERVDPQPRLVVERDDSELCSHGVSLDDNCAYCENDL